MFKLRHIFSQLHNQSEQNLTPEQVSRSVKNMKDNYKARRWIDCTIIANTVYAQRKLAAYLLLERD